MNWQTTEPGPLASDLHTQVAAVTDLLPPHGTGLLITLDEVHRRVAADLLNDDVLTFLRRAERHDLGAVRPRTPSRPCS